MAFYSDTIGPVEFSSRLGISMFMLRDWRKRGFLFGKEHSRNHYLYDKGDVLHGTIMQHLHKVYGFELAEAYRVAGWLLPEVAAEWGIKTPGLPAATLRRFCGIAPNQNPCFSNSAAEARATLGSAVVSLIEIPALIAELPKDIWWFQGQRVFAPETSKDATKDA